MPHDEVIREDISEGGKSPFSPRDASFGMLSGIISAMEELELVDWARPRASTVVRHLS